MTETKLKPCPFCGGEAEIIGEDEMYQVICMECDGSIDRFFDTPEEAAKDWNTRTPAENELPGKIGKLEAEIERLKIENASLRNYLKTARFYLSKVDSYISPIADEAHYFWDIQLENALKKGKKND